MTIRRGRARPEAPRSDCSTLGVTPWRWRITGSRSAGRPGDACVRTRPVRRRAMPLHFGHWCTRSQFHRHRCGHWKRFCDHWRRHWLCQQPHDVHPAELFPVHWSSWTGRELLGESDQPACRLKTQAFQNHAPAFILRLRLCEHARESCIARTRVELLAVGIAGDLCGIVTDFLYASRRETCWNTQTDRQ